jgi:spoIIIJ-associated protein
MEKYIEVTGKTEDAAISAGLRQLGLDRDDVSVEVLERAKTGFLGIGSSPARVKLTYQVEDEVVAPAAPVQKAETVKETAPVVKAAETVKEAPTERTAEPVAAPAPKAKATGDKAQQIEQFLTGLMEHLGNDARPVITLGEDGSFQVELVGSDLGALIGRRGETLDAIQQLTNYTVNRGQSKRVRVHLDAENYRAKREETLERLAQKTAGKALKYHRNMTLEPMNAYERHVIHAALQDYAGVTTYSTGTEPNRRVVVACEK